jgi:hypothetical protein
MIRVLSAVLLLQLVVVAALYWPRGDAEAPAPSLASGLARDSIDLIELRDSEGDELSIRRRDDGWVLANGLPAAPAMVDTLLTALLSGDTGLAIATSESAAERFKVAADDYERRIRLAGAEQERVVFLGTSPAFRKIHARRDGERSVYVVELNSYDAAARAERWLDRSLLATTDISSLELYGVRYTLDDGTWTREDGETVDDGAMESLLQVLSGLQVSGIVDDGDEDAAAAGETLRLDVETANATRRLTVLDNPDVERFYLSSDAFDATFDTSAYDAERLIDAARALAGIEPPAAEDAEDAEEEYDDESTLEDDGTTAETV